MKSIYDKYGMLTRNTLSENTTAQNAQKIVIDLKFLEAYTKYASIVRLAIESQRKEQSMAWLSRFKHDTDHKRRETMEKQWPSIFYYVQRAFSLPYDYALRNEDFNKNKEKYIKGIVINPEMISDNFLIELGLLDEVDRIPSLSGKTLIEKSRLQEVSMEKKVHCIDELKNILAHSRSIQTGIWNRTSWRILAVPSGQYIVFQEQKTSWVEKNKPNIQYIPKVYNDLYSLVRSMQYGSRWLSKRLWNIPTIKAELDGLYANWGVLAEDSKKAQVDDTLSKLASFKSTNIVNACNRLKEITYTHSSQDSWRILWAANDIGKHILTNEWKRCAIGHQDILLQHIVENEEVKFDVFSTSIINYLKQMDEEQLMKVIQDDKITPELNKKITQVIGVFGTYINEWKRNRFTWMPYSLLIKELDSTLEWIQNKEWKALIRILYRCLLIIKKFSYLLVLYKTKHGIKLKQNRTHLEENLLWVKNLLEEKSFLPQFESTENIKQNHRHMVDHLDQIIAELSQKWKDDKILNLIETEGM
jgi:hypothetical protein